jgi:diamine N-acetyltransferase
MITLQPITYDNFADCIRLEPHEHQKKFAASNLFSLAEAYVAMSTETFIPMPFAIYENDVMVGFIMLAYDPAGEDEDDETVYKICRLMIDKNHQGRGFGRRAMEKALEIIRTFPHGKADLVVLSYKPDNEAARSLYSSLGFRETGEVEDDEVWAVLEL